MDSPASPEKAVRKILAPKQRDEEPVDLSNFCIGGKILMVHATSIEQRHVSGDLRRIQATENFPNGCVLLSFAPAPELIVESNYHEESGGYEALQKLFELPLPPDAVFAASDPIAIGAMQAALDRGLRLPEQFGLIGVGGHHYGKYLRVPLSTVEQQRFRIGQAAARMLIEFINGPEPASPRQILVEPRLLVRASSCRSQNTISG